MSKHLYVFIDESGDPGYIQESGASSPYYSELCLQVNDRALVDLLSHILNWKYCKGRFYDVKTLPKHSDSTRFINPLKELHYRGELFCSCVYLVKERYIGPYLKPHSLTEQNPIFFRNYIHRKLLEFHFSSFAPDKDSEIQLVFDRYKMSSEANHNLERYLHRNWNLPRFEHICHVDSAYTDAIQVAGQLVNAVKDITQGKATKERKELLDFIALKDITTE